MPITTLQELKDAMALAYVFDVDKSAPAAPGGTTRFHTTWRGGTLPPAGAVPTTGAGQAIDDTTTGAILLPTLGGGKKFVLCRLDLAAATGTGLGWVYVYDRLVQTSGLSGTSTAVQTVNTVALPSRASGGDKVECFLEVHTAIGTTAVNATVTYTNQAGVAGRTSTISIGGASPAQGNCWPIRLMAGDTGVRSVQSVQLAATTGAVGDLGVTLRKPITDFGVSTKMDPRDADWLGLGLPVIDPAAALEFVWGSINANVSGTFIGQLHIAEIAA